MLDLKFFFIVELNLQHQAVQRLPLANEFVGQDWLTLTSDAFTSDIECIKACSDLMRKKHKQFKEHQKVAYSYAENPALSCSIEKLEDLDLNGFDEHSLVEIRITDVDGEWVARACVQVFSIDFPTNARRLH